MSESVRSERKPLVERLDPTPEAEDLLAAQLQRIPIGHRQMVSDRRYSRPVADDWDRALARTTDEGRASAEAVRSLVRRLDPGVVEVIWPHQGTVGWGIGPKKLTEHYAYLAVHPAHVNLGFYRGASLPDPADLLGGIGKNMRHIRIEGPGDVARPEIAELLRAAKAEREAALER